MGQEQIHLWVMAILLLAATLFLGIVSANILLMQRKNTKKDFGMNQVGQKINFVFKHPYGNTCDLKSHKIAA